ncbi:MAG TPA: HmuY family protein [Pedobacter sp.]
MRVTKYTVIAILCCMIFAYSSCKKDYIHIDYRRPLAADTLTLNGIAGLETGDNAANSVFVDLSKGVQTTVSRISWDLGFYCGVDTFRVIINHSHGATAIAVDKDLLSVKASDSVANATALSLDRTTGNIASVDPVSGSFSSYITGTVINEISANDANNKVYIICPGKGDDGVNRYYGIKVKISRITNGYSVSYSRLEDPGFNTVTVNKDPSYNFKYISFTSSVASVEPAKSLWDIEWGTSTYKNASAGAVLQPDFLMINFAAGVKAAQVMVADRAYKDFTKDDLAGITLSGNRDAIGVSWLNLTGSTQGGYAINTDRYYIIKDKQDNVYKLNFFGGGSRGKPIIQYNILVDSEPKNPGE